MCCTVHSNTHTHLLQLLSTVFLSRCGHGFLAHIHSNSHRRRHFGLIQSYVMFTRKHIVRRILYSLLYDIALLVRLYYYIPYVHI